MDIELASRLTGRVNTGPWQNLKPSALAPTPLYLQLAHALAEAINAGEWQVEEALPSERVLSEKLGISRVTARKALAVLVEHRIVSKRPGSGTFVEPRFEQPLSRLTSFTEVLRAKGHSASSVWLARTIDTPTHDEILKLGLSPSSQVARLERLRLADGIVMAVETSALPVSYLPDPAAVQSSLYDHLDAADHRIVRALQHIRAVNAASHIAELANIERGEAMLLVTRIGFAADNTAIELTATYCHKDYYDFVAELKR